MASRIKCDREKTIVLLENSVGNRSRWDRRTASARKFKVLIVLMVLCDRGEIRITRHRRTRRRRRHRYRGNIKEEMRDRLG